MTLSHLHIAERSHTLDVNVRTVLNERTCSSYICRHCRIMKTETTNGKKLPNIQSANGRTQEKERERERAHIENVRQHNNVRVLNATVKYTRSIESDRQPTHSVYTTPYKSNAKLANEWKK